MKATNAQIPSEDSSTIGKKNQEPRSVKNQTRILAAPASLPDSQRPGIKTNGFCLKLASRAIDDDVAQIEITPEQFQALQESAERRGISFDDLLLMGVAAMVEPVWPQFADMELELAVKCADTLSQLMVDSMNHQKQRNKDQSGLMIFTRGCNISNLKRTNDWRRRGR